MKHKHDNKLMAVLVIIGLYFLISFLGGCSKEIDFGGNNASLISYKFKADWHLVKIDTIWMEKNIVQSEFVKVLAAKQVDTLGKYDCPPLGNVYVNGVAIPFQYEIRKYIYQ